MHDTAMFCTTVIPTLGRATLDRAVKSVLSQELPSGDFEVVVVNDSGRSLTEAPWQNHRRVRLVHSNRRERSVARNLGAAMARSKYLHFLDDDDWLLPGAFSRLHDLAARTEAGWLYGATLLVDRRGRPLIPLRHRWQGNVFVQAMAGEWIPLQASLIRCDSFFAVGGFDNRLAGPEDVDICRRIALHFPFSGTQELVACIAMGAEQSSTDWQVHAGQSRRARERILDEATTFSRLRRSSGNSYWKGKILRIYATSLLWNLMHRHWSRIASRMVRTLGTGLLSTPYALAPDYWRAVAGSHQGFAFRDGQRNPIRADSLGDSLGREPSRISQMVNSEHG